MQVYEIRDGFGLDHLARAERPRPQPGPHEVLLRVRAVSLNYRDLLVTKGLYNPKMPLPRIPCSDGAGEVAAVGEGVTRVKPGARVAGIFHQRWLAGGITETLARTTLGGDLDGMIAEQVVFSED